VPATRIRIDTNHRGSENNNIATRIEGVAGQIPGDRNMLSASTIASSLALAALLAGAALAQPLLAPTPPMGWNSWDSFGTGVTEAEVKANADYMASRLAQVGWQYIVVDIQWSEPNPQSHGYEFSSSFGQALTSPEAQRLTTPS
jgi:hypothetical protein